VIFGSIVALFPVTLVGLSLTDSGRILTKPQMKLGMLSIILGYLAGLGVFCIYLLTKQEGVEDINTYAWAPIATFACSGIPALLLLASLRSKLPVSSQPPVPPGQDLQ